MDPALWNPKTEQDLEIAIGAGSFEESHHLDIKRELGSGKGANLELARDLASFAIDGGLLLLGVDEDETPPALHPVGLAGLAERVEQVALTRVDEPLAVSATVIPSGTDPSVGYLAIRIPQSALAPHMVDGRYWGRGDKTRHALSDDEVTRLHGRRLRWEESAELLLDQYVRRDPMPGGSQGHLFIVAEPVAATQGALVSVIEADGASWQQNLARIVDRALSRESGRRAYAPNLAAAVQPDRRTDGWALTSHDLLSGRQLAPNAREGSLVECEVSDNGTVRTYCGRGTHAVEAGVRVVFEGLVVGICHDVVAIALAMAEEIGYWGPWNFGVAMTHIQAAQSYSFREWLSAAPPPSYSEDTYRRTTRASVEELASRPNSVVDRLLGQVVRALGVRGTQEMRILLD